jgi:hypothetical protein
MTYSCKSRTGHCRFIFFQRFFFSSSSFLSLSLSLSPQFNQSRWYYYTSPTRVSYLSPHNYTSCISFSSQDIQQVRSFSIIKSKFLYDFRVVYTGILQADNSYYRYISSKGSVQWVKWRIPGHRERYEI